jgi:hypothetical protein
MWVSSRRAYALIWALAIRGEVHPENFGLLRRLALRLLKKETSSKRSNKGKRLRASWDDSYLLRVLGGNAEN